jgi:hypothetical protein
MFGARCFYGRGCLLEKCNADCEETVTVEEESVEVVAR